MVFSSSFFVFIFLPILFLLYFWGNIRYKNIVLLVFSLFFYGWGEPKNVLLMLTSITLNYAFGLGIEKKRQYSRIFLWTSVISNLGLLFFFKYLNFGVSIVNSLFNKNLYVREIALPIGISFFTFQIMSYVVDVYKKEVEAQKDIINLGLYISLFPQLIAGPIVRYSDVVNQIEHRDITVENVYWGIKRFAIGFSKKILIADQLSSVVDYTFAPDYSSIYGHWVGVVAYTLQIFFDFSGYSDMAIGLGKVFGFEFLENFNYPYISESIQEFWRRWHISLSSWFRDYVYIPLGGNRKGTLRTYINLICVFFLTGLWHGASYNFIVWGLFYAVFLIIERLGFKRLLNRIPPILRHIYSLSIIIIGWVFFRADDLGLALAYIKKMFVPEGKDFVHLLYVVDNQVWFCILIGIFFSIPHNKIKDKITSIKYGNHLLDIMVVVIFLTSICYMIGSGYSPFLYFRF